MDAGDKFKNSDIVDISCPKCNHGRAFFNQQQIRGGDEAATSFYNCCDQEKCAHAWKVD